MKSGPIIFGMMVVLIFLFMSSLRFSGMGAQRPLCHWLTRQIGCFVCVHLLVFQKNNMGEVDGHHFSDIECRGVFAPRL